MLEASQRGSLGEIEKRVAERYAQPLAALGLEAGQPHTVISARSCTGEHYNRREYSRITTQPGGSSRQACGPAFQGTLKSARRMRKADRWDGTRAARGREGLGAPMGAPVPILEECAVAAPSYRAAVAVLSQQSVWYRLMKLTNLINRPFFSCYAERYHLTINDARVLVTLASMANAAAHELCDATGMHPMNVSRSVATLRRQGRIAERRDPHNRRRKILRLTAKGWSVCRSFVPDMERMSGFLLSSMSGSEVRFLSHLVDQLIERLESASSDASGFDVRLQPARSGARVLR